MSNASRRQKNKLPDFINYPFGKYGLDVSRETREKFNIYAALLLKWQKVINLVSETTLEDLPLRHFVDSAQLIKYIPDANVKLADMGSGAGFPGLVLALLGIREVHLIESDVRKATFLREVSRETGAKAVIHDSRAEEVVIPGLGYITARALAPLSNLLVLADKISPERATCLFLKGEKTDDELAKAKKRWNFDLEVFPSLTDQTGKILKINNLVVK
jgi:16S rRNA (guanine527-N7)-methyltransferase